MGRGTTLLRLLDMYRAECRLSLNPAHNAQARSTQVYALQRWQNWLWTEYAWPLLRVDRYVPLQNGQRYYDTPEDLDIDRITSVEVKLDGNYHMLNAGIDAAHYSVHDSELDARDYPSQNWRITEDEQMEIWPIPDRNYDAATGDARLKITGIRTLKPLVDDDDRADLDDYLIVLYAAAEHLAATGSKDAALKQQAANARFSRLRDHQTPRRTFKLFTPPSDAPTKRIYYAVHKTTP